MKMSNKCSPEISITCNPITKCGPGISTGCTVEHKRLEALIKKEIEDRKETSASSDAKIDEANSKIDKINQNITNIESNLNDLDEKLNSITVNGGEIVEEEGE